MAAGTGLTGGGTSGDVTLNVDTSQIQKRVTGTCSAGSSIRVIDASGNVTCQSDTNSGGTVTSVGTGTGLTGGPITTTGTIAVASSFQLPQGCPANQIAKWSGSAWVCANDDNSGGTVTSVTAGSGLTGGSITTTGTISVANGGITDSMLAANSVDSSKIVDGSVTAAKISGSGATNGQVLKFNGTSVLWSTDSTGLGSFDQLQGLSCTRNGQAGTVDVSYTAGGAVLRCVTAARFFDNGDGTITDTSTGLQWEKKTDDGTVHDKDNTYLWSLTLNTKPDGTVFTDFLATLNSNCLGTSGDGSTVTAGFAGHCDWRLPTIAELRTILDCSFSICINPIFGPTFAGFYWSSTTSDFVLSNAWGGVFNFGDVVVDVKSNDNFVRAVRGGS